MPTPLLPSRQLPRRGALALGLAALAGCAAKPIVIDHAAMAEVKRVAVPTVGFPAYPQVRVLNATTDRLGLVGLLAGSIIRGNRDDAVKAMLASQGFDPRAYFQTALAERLAARGLTVLPEPADAARHDFLPAYAAGDGRDAVLDAWVAMYGFVALDDRDSSPFRPTASLNARLVNARDRSVLMQDTVLINGVARPAPAQGNPFRAPTFTSFSEIEANPERAVDGLRAALAAAADGVVGRLA